MEQPKKAAQARVQIVVDGLIYEAAFDHTVVVHDTPEGKVAAFDLGLPGLRHLGNGVYTVPLAAAE
jgi:hypothetical protein